MPRTGSKGTTAAPKAPRGRRKAKDNEGTNAVRKTAARNKLRKSLAALRQSVLPSELTLPLGLLQEEDECEDTQPKDVSFTPSNQICPSTPSQQNITKLIREAVSGQELVNASLAATKTINPQELNENGNDISTSIPVTPEERLQLLNKQLINDIISLSMNSDVSAENMEDKFRKKIFKLCDSSLHKSTKMVKKTVSAFLIMQIESIEKQEKEAAAAKLSNQRDLTSGMKRIVDTYRLSASQIGRLTTARKRLRSTQDVLVALNSISSSISNLQIQGVQKCVVDQQKLDKELPSPPLSSQQDSLATAQRSSQNPVTEQRCH